MFKTLKSILQCGKRPSMRDEDKIINRLCSRLLHRLVKVGEIFRKTPITTRPEQIGAGGDRHQTARDRIHKVGGFNPGRKRDRYLCPPLATPLGHQVHGDHMKGLAAEIHHLFRGGKKGSLIFDDQRVGKFNPQGAGDTTSPNGQLPSGEVGMDQIMNLMK